MANFGKAPWMRNLATSLLAVAALATPLANAQDDDGPGDCAGDDDCGPVPTDPPAIPDGSTLRYDDVARIIEQKCARCHAPGERAEFLPLVTKDDVLLMRDFMLDAINTGYMPRGNSSWRYTRKGLLLQAWLKNGLD